jgi:hypothetical protein
MLLAKFRHIPSPKEFSIKFSLISTYRSLSEFYFKIHFESEEIFIRKVVSYLKYFLAMFYFKFLEHEKILFGSNKV